MVVSIHLDGKSTQSRLDNLKIGRYERGYCEITPYRAFIGKQNGVTIIVYKVNV